MKKLISLSGILIIGLVFFVACNKDEPPTQPVSKAIPPEPSTTGTGVVVGALNNPQAIVIKDALTNEDITIANDCHVFGNGCTTFCRHSETGYEKLSPTTPNQVCDRSKLFKTRCLDSDPDQGPVWQCRLAVR